jgi:hypothetical protein
MTIKSIPLLFLLIVPVSGCALLESELSKNGLDDVPLPDAPTASLKTIELTKRPTNSELTGYYCDDLAGGNFLAESACVAAFGDPPSKSALQFGFVTIFELENTNDFPIPMVEVLLALDVFEGSDQAELGAVCISFCNPESEACAPPDAPCRVDDPEVRDLATFEPTVEDFIELAAAAVTGELFEDNNQFRFIPAADGDEPGRLEARIHFDIGLDPMVDILQVVAVDSTDDILAGRKPSFDVPYSVRGNLFFDVQVLGRLAIGFGPFDGVWSLD